MRRGRHGSKSVICVLPKIHRAKTSVFDGVQRAEYLRCPYGHADRPLTVNWPSTRTQIAGQMITDRASVLDHLWPASNCSHGTCRAITEDVLFQPTTCQRLRQLACKSMVISSFSSTIVNTRLSETRLNGNLLAECSVWNSVRWFRRFQRSAFERLRSKEEDRGKANDVKRRIKKVTK